MPTETIPVNTPLYVEKCRSGVYIFTHRIPQKTASGGGLFGYIDLPGLPRANCLLREVKPEGSALPDLAFDVDGAFVAVNDVLGSR